MTETTTQPNNRLVVYRKKTQREFMPYKSSAQAAYFNIHKDELEKQGVDVAEWNASSKGKKLPKHVKKLNKRGVISDREHAKIASKWGKDDAGINASSR